MGTDRNEHPSEISKVGDDFSYLAPFVEDDQSTAAMAEHRILSRIKTIQALTEESLREACGVGSLVIMPAKQLLITPEETIDFVPLAFFEEFILWRDRRDTEAGAIEARSMSKTSELAKRARDPKLWEEVYAGGTKDKPFKKRYTEHLNFPGIIYSKDHELYRVPVCLSFSRGEFTVGRQFISQITLRRVQGRQAPLWATVWTLSVGSRKNNNGSWYGIDVANAERPFIDQEHVESFKSEYETLTEQIAKQLVAVDMSESDDPVATTSEAPKNSPF